MVLDLPGLWKGWKIQKTGRRNYESLIAPDGTEYVPSEILELRRMTLDLDYLQVELKRLKKQVTGYNLHLTPEQLTALLLAAEILTEALPTKKRKFDLYINHDHNINGSFNFCRCPRSPAEQKKKQKQIEIPRPPTTHGPRTVTVLETD